LERSLQQYGKNIWDQSLVYSHYNLHDTSLLDDPIDGHPSYFDYCLEHQILVLAAAPLSMGLLTHASPPEWHPASVELKKACHLASDICDQNGVDLPTLAILFALTNPRIPTTILGMGCIEEAKTVHSIALRCRDIASLSWSRKEILDSVLSDAERKVLELIRDPVGGPFATVWQNDLYQWNGVQIARDFWELLPDQKVEHWQRQQNSSP
jgi:Aldo/keto reductase family